METPSADESALRRLNAELYDAFGKDAGPTTAFLQWMVDSYGLTCPPRVLDVGCGTGRMLREFDRMGWNAVGMEPDVDFLAEAEGFDRQSKPVDVRPGGFNEIDESDTYDLVVSIDGPFSYLLTVKERAEALGRIYCALRPGGVVFLDIANFLWMLRHFEEFRESSAPLHGRAARRIQHFRLDFHEHLWTQIDEFQYDDPEIGPVRLSKTHRCAIVTLPELRHFLYGTGFDDIHTYASYDARESQPLTGHDFLISAQRPCLPD